MRTTNSNDHQHLRLGGDARAGLAGVVSAALIAVVTLAAIVLPALTRPSAALLLTSVGAMFALAASASLAKLAITDVRDRVVARRAAARSA